MEIFGIIGALAFSVCNIPLIFGMVVLKDGNHVSWMYLILSFIGNFGSMSYIFYTNLEMGFWQWPQYLNYGLAITELFILTICKLKYTRETKTYI